VILDLLTVVEEARARQATRGAGLGFGGVDNVTAEEGDNRVSGVAEPAQGEVGPRVGVEDLVVGITRRDLRIESPGRVDRSTGPDREFARSACEPLLQVPHLEEGERPAHDELEFHVVPDEVEEPSTDIEG
jgi:hypothetical protein